MKTPLETSRLWLAQAEHSLTATQALLELGFWADACFHAEQTAQLGLKAYLFFKGRRYVNIHSVRTLALECGKEDADFLSFEEYGSFLDRYYLTTRYPDALPAPSIPFQSFFEQEARQAVDQASEIVKSVRDKIPSESADPEP
ncbi:MAG: hypothetical protein BZY75_05225 [SAR202 cluster bacterium Io17-Chloro-G7]|nr:MAG: hypothetical protein BZY75_05225 [SAR202 cluster bacterium Io17-Chloro-G7]